MNTKSLVALLVLVCALFVQAELPFEQDYRIIASASFIGTSINHFSGNLAIPTPPYDPTQFFAAVLKLESITVTEGVAAILSWNPTINNGTYQVQLYYTVNGVDSTWSKPALISSDDLVLEIQEYYDYTAENWMINATTNSTSVSLTLPTPLTLGQATVELATNFNTTIACSALPTQDFVSVSNILWSCALFGCGPWIPTTWNICATATSAANNEAYFVFNASSSNSFVN